MHTLVTASPWASAVCLMLVACSLPAASSDRLTATGGVTQIEGAAGGGLVPWALIAGTGTADQIGATANLTRLGTRGGYALRAAGLSAGFYNRFEISASRLDFGLSDTVPGRSIAVDTVGLKLRIAGDAIYDQDSPWPQISLGVLRKHNRDYDGVPRAVGARSAIGTDIYVAATKVWLAGLAGRNLLANVTLRSSNANQFGILGFGGPNGGSRLLPEVSGSVFLTDRIALGFEARLKPNQLAAFREQAAHDLFVAWFPSRHVSLTAAYVNLGNIADKPAQTGWYLSMQLAY